MCTAGQRLLLTITGPGPSLTTLYSFIVPLGEWTYNFIILTGLWIGFAAVFQLGVIVYLTCRGKADGPFQSLPPLIRVLVFIATPVLLAPAIISLYGAYIAFVYKIDKEVIAKIYAIIFSLTMVHVIFESVPQLATQCAALTFLFDSMSPDGIVTILR